MCMVIVLSSNPACLYWLAKRYHGLDHSHCHSENSIPAHQAHVFVISKSMASSLHKTMAVARNLCAGGGGGGGGGGQARGMPVTPVFRGVWGHAPPEIFEI